MREVMKKCSFMKYIFKLRVLYFAQFVLHKH
jgi:hypothetical protein